MTRIEEQRDSVLANRLVDLPLMSHNCPEIVVMVGYSRIDPNRFAIVGRRPFPVPFREYRPGQIAVRDIVLCGHGEGMKK